LDTITYERNERGIETLNLIRLLSFICELSYYFPYLNVLNIIVYKSETASIK